MSFLKKPFRKLKEMNEKNVSSTSTDSVPSKTEGINSGSGSDTTPENEETNGKIPKLNGDSKRQS
jgi:hypothetical protein